MVNGIDRRVTAAPDTPLRFAVETRQPQPVATR